MSKRWRVVVEELERHDGDDDVWSLSIYRRHGARWRLESRQPEFYNTSYAALTTARDWILRRTRDGER